MTSPSTKGVRARLGDKIRLVLEKSKEIDSFPWSMAAISKRNSDQAEMLRPYIGEGDTVLDVGCGTGHLTICLKELFGAEPTGLDVIDLRQVDIPFQQFDGRIIPFEDNSFDHVVLSFTLHHCGDPLTVIQECRRVARRSILIYEDMPNNAWTALMLKLHVLGFRLHFKLGPAGDYRAALAWLEKNSTNCDKASMPYEWFDKVYAPRVLLAYSNSN